MTITSKLVQTILWTLILTTFVLIAYGANPHLAVWPAVAAFAYLALATWIDEHTDDTSLHFHFHWPSMAIAVLVSAALVVTPVIVDAVDEEPVPICGPAGCSDPEIGAAESCAGYPFCLFQHGYCAKNCTAARVCDPTGCSVTEDTLRLLEQQYSRSHISQVLRDNDLGVLRADGTVSRAEDGCDNRRCDKTYGWPWCHLC